MLRIIRVICQIRVHVLTRVIRCFFIDSSEPNYEF